MCLRKKLGGRIYHHFSGCVLLFNKERVEGGVKKGQRGMRKRRNREGREEEEGEEGKRTEKGWVSKYTMLCIFAYILPVWCHFHLKILAYNYDDMQILCPPQTVQNVLSAENALSQNFTSMANEDLNLEVTIPHGQCNTSQIPYNAGESVFGGEKNDKRNSSQTSSPIKKKVRKMSAMFGGVVVVT